MHFTHLCTLASFYFLFNYQNPHPGRGIQTKSPFFSDFVKKTAKQKKRKTAIKFIILDNSSFQIVLIGSMTQVDCAIIGGGPAGLAVAIELEKQGIKYIILEKKHIGYNVSRFPIAMRFFSSRALLEIDEFALTIPDEKPTREQYLTYLFRLAAGKNLKIRDYTEVKTVQKNKGGFELSLTDSLTGEESSLQASTVVCAFGALDRPNMLGVKGEDLPHVSHYFPEIYPYLNHRVLIVGSGNSAVETALLLYRAGAKVSLSFREKSLNEKKIKYWLYPDIQKRLAKEQIVGYAATKIVEIEPHGARLKTQDGQKFFLETDFILLLTGYRPDPDYLRAMHVEVNPDTCIPAHDTNTLESNVEGLFMAGAITGGNVSGKVFIENSRFHGTLIAPRIKEILKKKGVHHG